MLSLHDVPGSHFEWATLPAHGAADATAKVPVFVAPLACEVVAVVLWAVAAVSGTDTDTTSLNLTKGATELAAIDYVSGTDAVAGAAIDYYSPATALSMAAADQLVVEIETVASGLALPQFLVRTEFRYT